MEIKVFGDGAEMREVPAEFVLLRKGKNKFTINGKQAEFDAGDDDIQSIMQEFGDRKKDLVVDYDHATLDKRATAIGDAPAAGWVRLEANDNGIVAKVLNWTKKAKERIMNGEYRYFSPVIHFNENKPKAIQSIGLTNHPAIHEQMPLVAANDLLDGTAIIDDGTEMVLSNYEAMTKRLKSAIGELQTELKNTLEGYTNLSSTSESIQRRVTAFTDSLFAEELKAFADVTAVVVTPLADVQKDVAENIMKGLTVDGILADNTLTLGARAQKLGDIMAGLNMKLEEYRNLLNTVTDEQKPQVNAIIDYLNQVASEVRGAMMRLDAIAGAVPMADTSEEAVKKNILDYIQKSLKAIPMTAGKVLQAVMDDLKAYTNLPGNVEATIKAVETPETPKVEEGAAVITPSPEFVAKMNDLGLTTCSNEDELYKAMSDLSSAKKAVEEKLEASKKESDEKITALNDTVATLKAEQMVDKVISEKHGKITASMRDWAINFAKRDPKGFIDHVAKAPVAFADIDKEDREAASAAKAKKAYSPEQIRYAQAFGHKPEDVYE